MFKKILLTGGTGFLGSYLAKALLSQGHEVYLFIRDSSSKDRLDPDQSKFKYIKSVDKLDSNFDAFFHLATCYGRKGESREEIEGVNIALPLKILDKIKNDYLEIYLVGTSLPKETNLYAQSKWDLYEQLKDKKPKHLLLEHFYGPRDNSFVGFIINTLRNGSQDVELTAGTQKRDFIYYKDVIDAILFIFKHSNKFKDNIEVGSGVECSIKEIVNKLKDFFPNSKTAFHWGVVPFRDNEVMSSVANLEKLSEAGWKPSFDLNRGFSDFL